MKILRQKIFFEYGLTSKDIDDYAFGHNMSKKDAYNALKESRASQGVAQTSYKDFDKSTFKGSVLQGSKDANGSLAQGVVGQSGGGNFTVSKNKTSASQQAVQAQQAHGANENRFWADKNKYANLKKQGQAFNQGQATGFQQGQQSVGLKQGAINTWNNMGTVGKVATGAALVGGAALLMRNRQKRKEAEQQLAAERAKNNAKY